MNRQHLIEEEGNRFMQPVLRQSMTALMKAYKTNEAMILEAFRNAVEELFLTAVEQQLNGKKGALSYMGICYCLSSIYTGNYELRLDLYDGDFYLDEGECCVYWDPSFFAPYLENDIAYFRKTIRQKVPRIRTYEEQQFIAGYMRNYMYIVLEFLKQKMPDVLGQIKKNSVEISGELQIFFGEYMGRCAIVNFHPRKEGLV